MSITQLSVKELLDYEPGTVFPDIHDVVCENEVLGEKDEELWPFFIRALFHFHHVHDLSDILEEAGVFKPWEAPRVWNFRCEPPVSKVPHYKFRMYDFMYLYKTSKEAADKAAKTEELSVFIDYMLDNFNPEKNEELYRTSLNDV